MVIAISVFVFTIREQAEKYAVYGYPGILIISFLAYATVLLPAPGIAIIFTMGAVFHPIGVALAAGVGATIGEFTGYLVGFSGQAVIERIDIFEKLSEWMQKNGSFTILVLSAIPNPFFDLAGVTAGVLKMPVHIFLFWCWIGETIKMLIFSYLGDSLIYLLS
ncbi:MAG: VTT domain-containing protein [Anaerolineales bacterium]|nr:MAG: VTT domain-containing protein [Anaerolineales bacterium]